MGRSVLILWASLATLAAALGSSMARDEKHFQGHAFGQAPHVVLAFDGPADGPERRPPGWDRGRKTGWGNCDLPPGLAKKQGCHPVFWRQLPSGPHNPVIVISLP